ncbi:PHD-finger [Opisthorchis viverrini]|uniref:PHD-finger n=1 Tax=Opisthorchis viverrini TaxID=6198 RepID=A0A1S8WZI9_OPIVI|nr:PHD-finger [Opisthorchis viverrini]
MLDFINAKTNNPSCSLCNGVVMQENCSPKGCTHVFHSTCFEDWSTSKGSSDEYTCPAIGCSVKFTEVVVRKTPLGPASKIVTVGESNQCPICCEALQKPIATPESCNHTFCYVCLREWSRVRHECPLDRGAFELILLSDTVGGPIVKRVTAPPVELNSLEEPFEEIDTTCEICTLADDEAHLLLCDHCDRGYHTYCLPVPLSSVPPGDWFCPDCVRHGIGRNSTTSTSSTTTRTSGRRATRRRRPFSSIVDREAEESDALESDDTHDGLSEDQDENFVGVHRISAATQRILRQRANSRYRGSRLLQDTILNLAERVLNEASARARHRRTQRQRVRRQLAAEQTGQTRLSTATTSNQLTLRLEPPTEPNGPTQLRLSSPNSAEARDHRSGRRTAAAEDTAAESRSQARRRRLLILSDSASESEMENGIQLPLPSLRRDRFPRISGRTNESDTDLAPSSSVSATAARASKRIRLSSSTGSDSPLPSTSQTVPEQPSPQTSLRAGPSSSKPKKRKTKKVRRNKTKKTGKVTRRIKKRVTAALRKKKRRTLTIQKSSSSNNTSTASTSFHRSPRKATFSNRLPRLSVFGAEPTCSLFVEDSVPDTTSETTQKPEPMPSPIYRPSRVSLLDEIEAGQKSLFSFTTRHMNVNPDHSMSPIPVPSRPEHTLNSYNSPNMRINLPLRAPSTTGSVSPSVSSAPSSSAPCRDETPSRELFKSELNSQSSKQPGSRTSSHSHFQNQWSDELLRNARSVLKASLKPQLNTGVIDESTYRSIMERALFKIQQKDVSKVSDARISKLAKDYLTHEMKASKLALPSLNDQRLGAFALAFGLQANVYPVR